MNTIMVQRSSPPPHPSTSNQIFLAVGWCPVLSLGVESPTQEHSKLTKKDLEMNSVSNTITHHLYQNILHL